MSKFEKVPPDMNEDVFTLPEGVVVFQWPNRLSQESYDDLESWLEIFLRKVKRRATSGGEKVPVELGAIKRTA